MNVKRVTIHNVMGVRDIDMNMSGHNLFLIGGRNGQGKSSAIRALIMALCGRSGCEFPAEPLRHGESEGWVRIEMDGDKTIFQDQLIVERRFERREDGTVREKLRVIGDSGFEAPTPQKLLSQMYKTRGIDPSHFLSMSPQEQAAELKRIVGIDTSEIDKQRDKAFSERTMVNRELKGLEERFKAAKHHEDAPAQPVSVMMLMNQRKAIESKNRERENQRRNVELEMAKGYDKQGLANRQREAAEQTAARIKHMLAEIENLRQLEQECISRAKALDAQAVEIFSNAEASLGAIDADESLEEIDSNIRNAESINAMVRENEQRDRLKAELDKKKKESEALTRKIADADKARQKMIEEANWPMESLRFEGGMVYYHDVPLKDCSTAEQVTVSTVMSMKMNPNLKLLTIQRGESMDNETMSIIEDLAVRHGYQLLVERVTRSEEEDRECQVVFEDGAAKE